MTRRPVRVVRESKADHGWLLDTHAWVWLLAGDESRLGQSTRALLADAAAERRLHVSDVSCWELAFKVEVGRYQMSLPLDQWLDRALQAPGITMLPLDRDILLLGARLTAMHGDPADRWLVATAKLHRLTLVTADAAILRFAQKEGLTAVWDART